MKNSQVKPDAAAVSMTRSDYRAPMPAIEYVYFTHGSNTAAAYFGVTHSRLARYIGSEDRGSLVSKAMEEMKLSTLTDLKKPGKQSTVSEVADMALVSHLDYHK